MAIGGRFYIKKDNRHQFQWQTVLRKDNLDIQHLTLGPITNDDSDNQKLFQILFQLTTKLFQNSLLL